MRTTDNTTNWTNIEGYNGHYQVSDTGRVRSTNRTITYASGQTKTYKGKELSPGDNGNGYQLVYLTQDGNTHWHAVHTLVMEAFLGDQPTPNHECNHIDGDKTNNHVENLEWTTRKENAKHAHSNGLHSGRGKQKLNPDKVRAIRRKYETGEYSYAQLGSEYEISVTHCSNVVRGVRWAHVS